MNISLDIPLEILILEFNSIADSPDRYATFLLAALDASFNRKLTTNNLLNSQKIRKHRCFSSSLTCSICTRKKFSDRSTSSSDWHWLFAFANRKLQIVAPRESWPIIGQYFLDEKVLLPRVSQKLMNMILDSRFKWIAFKLIELHPKQL